MVVTDMRTYRLFTTEGSLLDKTAYDNLTKVCKDVPPNKPIVLVSGTPLLNWQPVSYLCKLGLMVGSSEKTRKSYEVGDLWDDYREGRASNDSRRMVVW